MRPDVLIINYNSNYPLLLLSSPLLFPLPPTQKDRKDIRGEVSDDEVSVVVEEGLDDRDQGLRGAKHALLDRLEDCLQPGVSRDLSSTKNSIRTEVLLGRGAFRTGVLLEGGKYLIADLAFSTCSARRPKMNMLCSPTHSAISTLAPSIVPFVSVSRLACSRSRGEKERRGREEKGRGGEGRRGREVPMIREPLMANFMLEVPLASVPAVEICWLMSAAGVMTCADDTL